MKKKFLKLTVMTFSFSSLVVGSYFLWGLGKSVDQLKSLPVVEGAMEKSASSSENNGKKQDVAEGSEGHGDSAKSEGGHGEEAKAESEHGGGHGSEGGDRKPASVVSKGMPLFSLEELYVNVNSDKGAHMMGLKLELELFEEQQRNLVKSHQSGIRDRIIEVSRGFDYGRLKTLGGKLYFKELIVTHINEFLGQPMIKNAHISSLYLQ